MEQVQAAKLVLLARGRGEETCWLHMWLAASHSGGITAYTCCCPSFGHAHACLSHC